ncbi:MAG: hypothetical protein DBX55_09300 [Verrucomicrobia bacterium]|nr:MAG: hypothetical protein DBX55_09300 [Verrucomicrobiota bacterium]
MNKEYQKGEKIRLFKEANDGRWAKYESAISPEELDALKYACTKMWATKGNDAPRGGKLGDFFEILRDFSAGELEETMKNEISELNAKLDETLKSEIIYRFATVSNIGSFVIDGVKYSNFYGNGENKVDVCACTAADFKSAKYLTRREIYNAKEPISIVRFDFPKSIKVSVRDYDESFGSETINNALGFAIWQRKLKIFVEKKID